MIMYCCQGLSYETVKKICLFKCCFFFLRLKKIQSYGFCSVIGSYSFLNAANVKNRHHIISSRKVHWQFLIIEKKIHMVFSRLKVSGVLIICIFGCYDFLLL